MPPEGRHTAFRFRTATGTPRSRVASCRRALEAEGIALASDAPASSSPTVAFFAEATGGFLTLLGELSRQGRVLAVRLTSDGDRPGDAWDLLEAGASDVLSWDGDRSSAQAAAARLHRWRAVDGLLDAPVVRDNLVGDSGPWRSTLRQVVETARFSANAVLLTGETGTGKELVARLIHALDPRPDRADLVVVDCTTIVPTLSGSELFGHEKGSFTGAETARDGAFGLAHQGTLFLDEVGELPLDLQAELLRVIQEGTYKRVGSNRWRSTAFRLVCATNRDLGAQVQEGRFRSDLYFRIAASHLRLPALRDRAQDVLPLARHFVGQLLPDHPAPHFADEVTRYLLERPYPGNVRELRQLTGRLVARHAGPGPITVGDVPPEDRPTPARATPDAPFQRAARSALSHGLTLTDGKERLREAMIALAVDEEAERRPRGHLQRAAERLDVSVRTLQLWQRQRSGHAGSNASG